MMKRSLMIATGLAFAAGYLVYNAADVLAQQPQGKPSLGERSGANSTLGIAPSTAEFVKDVALSDMFEISSSKLATEKGDDPTKQFAQHMLEDHGKTTEQLKGLMQTANIGTALPDSLDNSHRKKLDKLKSLKGGDFNKRYRTDQVDAHKTAVSLFERYAESGDDPGLKKWAGETLPTLKSHLEMAQALPH